MLLKLCNQYGQKPTPVLKGLNLSPGNLEKWKNGATVNSEVLLKLSEHFSVSIDYLLKGIDTEKSPASELTEDEAKALIYYKRLNNEDKDLIKGEMVRLYKDETDSKKDSEFAKELGIS